jgi:hypothetical protein
MQSDLKEALMKIRTMRASGGDTFFIGLAQMFIAKP